MGAPVAGATGVALAPVRRAVSGPLPLAERGVDADVESPLPRLGVTGADAVLLVSPMSSRARRRSPERGLPHCQLRSMHAGEGSDEFPRPPPQRAFNTTRTNTTRTSRSSLASRALEARHTAASPEEACAGGAHKQRARMTSAV